MTVTIDDISVVEAAAKYYYYIVVECRYDAAAEHDFHVVSSWFFSEVSDIIGRSLSWMTLNSSTVFRARRLI